MKTLAFIHGWGFDAHFWRPVADRLPEFARVFIDLGFRGEPVHPAAHHPVVIAHSMGFAWALASLSRPWAGAVAVNAFTRFTRTPDFVAGTPPRTLERMTVRFADDPLAVSAEFLERCGVEAPDTAGLRPAPLGEALKWLAICDERNALAALDCPLLALAGTRDPIVSETMSRESFPPQCLTLVEGAGHLLPWTHPDWVASQIRVFASGLR